MSRQAASHRIARELHGTAREEHGIALLTNAEELTGRPMPSKGNSQPRFAPKRKGIELNRLESQLQWICMGNRRKATRCNGTARRHSEPQGRCGEKPREAQRSQEKHRKAKRRKCTETLCIAMDKQGTAQSRKRPQRHWIETLRHDWQWSREAMRWTQNYQMEESK